MNPTDFMNNDSTTHSKKVLLDQHSTKVRFDDRRPNQNEDSDESSPINESMTPQEMAEARETNELRDTSSIIRLHSAFDDSYEDEDTSDSNSDSSSTEGQGGVGNLRTPRTPHARMKISRVQRVRWKYKVSQPLS